MIRKEDLRIIRSKVIALDTVEMTLHNSYISQNAVPGQFIHMSVPNYTLRRPISIANVDRESELITIVFKVIGDGTKKLATLQAGDTVNALGPCGNGFDINTRQTSVLLIGGGVGIPPLHYLGHTLSRKDIKIISVLGFQSKQNIFYEEKFRSFSKQTIVVTDDGSYGEQGLVTDALHIVNDFDIYYTCGPLPMLRAVTNALAHKKGYISLEERMGCGIGACYACVIPTSEEGGYRKICQDGPVFSAKEVVLS